MHTQKNIFPLTYVRLQFSLKPRDEKIIKRRKKIKQIRMPIAQWLEYVRETKRGNFSYYNTDQQRKQKSQKKTTQNLFLKVIYVILEDPNLAVSIQLQLI